MFNLLVFLKTVYVYAKIEIQIGHFFFSPILPPPCVCVMFTKINISNTIFHSFPKLSYTKAFPARSKQQRMQHTQHYLIFPTNQIDIIKQLYNIKKKKTNISRPTISYNSNPAYTLRASGYIN
eukprot:TRINITY_DN4143_c0_g1_i3.p1 TRINITY_DN4143_c0_g1~~TRINITY_DN4143_c0_g1_i3.p1  ORF type:complete len:123 (+),score=0.29 TRINITY_DN4143_c0_g1_i3:2-370(+)